MPEGSRSTIVIWAIAAVLATLAAVRALGSGDDPPAEPIRLSESAGARTDGGRAASRIYVHVAGAVRRPGLMTLAPGSRVADGLARAGGPTRRAELTGVNLAARLEDGQQIVVPAAGSAGAAAAPPGGLPSTAGGSPGVAAPRVQLSTATVEQLDGIDGIGPTLAQRIIEYRDAHGGLRSLAELGEVEGIGEKRLATLRDALQP